MFKVSIPKISDEELKQRYAISEILSQIHKRFLPSVIAFEVIKNPRENEVLYGRTYLMNS